MSATVVYDVTRALRTFLYSRLVRVSPSAVVSLLPPGNTLPDVSGINLYLYRVMESPSTKNRPWPGDRRSGPTPQPALGLNLSYLLTPLGKTPPDGSFDQGDDAHTMLGVAMLAFQQYPILNDVHLPADDGPNSGFDADDVLSASLLASFEQIKTTLAPMSVEEFSKIWSTMNQPYRLSVAYDVTLIEITADEASPALPAPVTRTALEVSLDSAPSISELVPATSALGYLDANGHVLANVLTIHGSGSSVRGRPPVVTFGDETLTIVAVGASTVTAILPLDIQNGPANDIRIAVTGLRSRPASFTADPWLARISPVRSALDAQSSVLALNGSGFTSATRAVRFENAAGTTTVDAVTGGPSSVSVAIPELANGTYNVRLINGNDATNARSLEIIPLASSAVFASSGSGKTVVDSVTISGSRLAGSAVSVIVDGTVYATGANTNPASVNYTFGRTFAPGRHEVGVVVDGSPSHVIGVER